VKQKLNSSALRVKLLAKASIVVIEDKDEPPGYGAFWGEVQTNVHKALDCLGTVTNGSIRDLAPVAEGFQMLAGSIAPSHAYEHVVEFDISSRDYAEHDGRSCCNHLLAHYSVLLMFHRRWIASARTAVIVLLRLGGLMHFRWLLKSSSSAAFLLMAVLAARSDGVPVLDLNPICRGIAQQAWDAGEAGPDWPDWFARCIRSEQAVRKRLVRKWSRYAVADKHNCIAETTMGGLASYTDLFGCLQSATEARNLFKASKRNYQTER
jgi:hypothetical protein